MQETLARSAYLSARSLDIHPFRRSTCILLVIVTSVAFCFFAFDLASVFTLQQRIGVTQGDVLLTERKTHCSTEVGVFAMVWYHINGSFIDLNQLMWRIDKNGSRFTNSKPEMKCEKCCNSEAGYSSYLEQA